MGTLNVSYLQLIQQAISKIEIVEKIDVIVSIPTSESTEQQQRLIPISVTTSHTDGGSSTSPKYYYDTFENKYIPLDFSTFAKGGIDLRTDELQFKMLPKSQMVFKIYYK